MKAVPSQPVSSEPSVKPTTPPDFSKFTDDDLRAMAAGNIRDVSDAGLRILAGEELKQQEGTASASHQTMLMRPAATAGVYDEMTYSFSAIVVGALLTWLVLRKFWGKPRYLPSTLGMWIGGWFAGLGAMLGVRGNILFWNPTVTPMNIWLEYFLVPSAAITLAFFSVGFLIGYGYRRHKPIAPLVPIKKSGSLTTEEQTNAQAFKELNGADKSNLAKSTVKSAPVSRITETSPVRYPSDKTVIDRVRGKNEDLAAVFHDEALYELALSEISNGKRHGLWAMALEQTAQGGNTEGAYIALRVQQLKTERQSDLKARQKAIDSGEEAVLCLKDGRFREEIIYRTRCLQLPHDQWVLCTNTTFYVYTSKSTLLESMKCIGNARGPSLTGLVRTIDIEDVHRIDLAPELRTP